LRARKEFGVGDASHNAFRLIGYGIEHAAQAGRTGVPLLANIMQVLSPYLPAKRDLRTGESD
jgi:hypothetical protein